MPFNYENVRKLREKLSLTQVELSDLIISYYCMKGKQKTIGFEAVRKWEKGLSQPPIATLDVLNEIAANVEEFPYKFYSEPQR